MKCCWFSPSDWHSNAPFIDSYCVGLWVFFSITLHFMNMMQAMYPAVNKKLNISPPPFPRKRKLSTSGCPDECSYKCSYTQPLKNLSSWALWGIGLAKSASMHRVSSSGCIVTAKEFSRMLGLLFTLISCLWGFWALNILDNTCQPFILGPEKMAQQVKVATMGLDGMFENLQNSRSSVVS